MARIPDIKAEGRGDVITKPVIEDGAIGRVLAGGLFRRERSVGPVVPAEAVSGLRREQVDFGVGQAGAELAERSDVIEDPE